MALQLHKKKHSTKASQFLSDKLHEGFPSAAVGYPPSHSLGSNVDSAMCGLFPPHDIDHLKDTINVNTHLI